MIKILHTADIHLGREFPLLHEKGREYRSQLLRTFERIVDLAIGENISLLLIAGDLFDTNRVHGIIIGKVLSAFRKLEKRDIQVCILPGTHDAYNDDSIYRFVHFPSNVTVFTPQHDHEIYKDLDLTVYGKAFDGRLVGESPIRGLSLTDATKFHVGMAHCSIKREDLIEKDSMILSRDEIANSGLDYLALGHWHSFQDFSQGNTKACYCGSPEPIYVDQKGAGSIAMVSIHEKGNVGVAPVCVGSKKFDEVTIDVGLVKSIEDIAKIVEPKADPNLILKITLEGLCNTDYDLSPQEIEDAFGGQFFCLRVLDQSHPKLDEVRAKDFSEETVIGRFIKIMEGKLDKASQEERVFYEDALKLGFALLQRGWKVIE